MPTLSEGAEEGGTAPAGREEQHTGETNTGDATKQRNIDKRGSRMRNGTTCSNFTCLLVGPLARRCLHRRRVCCAVVCVVLVWFVCVCARVRGCRVVGVVAWGSEEGDGSGAPSREQRRATERRCG